MINRKIDPTLWLPYQYMVRPTYSSKDLQEVRSIHQRCLSIRLGCVYLNLFRRKSYAFERFRRYYR